MEETISLFKHRLVRDLAWVISSPPLVSGSFNNTHWWDQTDCLTEFRACLPALLELDKQPSPLVEHIESLKPGRLGLRFEALIAYWLGISPNFTLLAKNLQVIIEGHTYGEVDFLIQNTASQEVIHLEVALKFYLGTTPYNDPYRWFGTNTQDQLGKKVDHLKSQQTQIYKQHTKFFNDLGFTIDKQHCLLKGRLFYPPSINTSPQGVALNHLKGYWIQAPEVVDSDRLYSIEKPLWLAELQNNDINVEQIQSDFALHEWPRCYVNLSQEEGGNFIERSRLFYLPEDFRFPK